MSREQGFDSIQLGLKLREKALHLESREVFIASIPSEEVEGSRFARINCRGYGLLRKSVTARPDWPEIDVVPEISAKKLGVLPEDVSWTQIFRDGICNYRCWYCFVDFRFLKGECKAGKFFTADKLLDLSQQEDNPPRVITLSGGEPDLLPEWTLWMMQALERRGLDNTYYLWQDDNLGTEFLWKFLRPEEVDYMRHYKNYGRAACLKGFSPTNFYENSGSHPSLFFQQLRTLTHLVKDGFDVYAYLPLLSHDVKTAACEIPAFIDMLREKVHPNMPLRVFPSKIVEYPNTVRRLTPFREEMLSNQRTLLDIWQAEMAKRYSVSELSTVKSEVVIH